MTGLIGCVLAVWVAQGSAVPPPSGADASAGIEVLWLTARTDLHARVPRAHWLHLRTPLLPLSWPPAGDSAWLRYHYAGGGEPDLKDAVWVARPFALEFVGRDGRSQRVQALAEPGTDRQGVRPLSGALSGPSPADADRVALTLTQVPPDGSAEATLLRQVHGDYWRAHTVLGEFLRSRHRDFFEWLEALPPP